MTPGRVSNPSAARRGLRPQTPAPKKITLPFHATLVAPRIGNHPRNACASVETPDKVSVPSFCWGGRHSLLLPKTNLVHFSTKSRAAESATLRHVPPALQKHWLMLPGLLHKKRDEPEKETHSSKVVSAFAAVSQSVKRREGQRHVL